MPKAEVYYPDLDLVPYLRKIRLATKVQVVEAEARVVLADAACKFSKIDDLRKV